MTTTTPAGTAPGTGAGEEAVTPLPPNSVPFTTVTTGSQTDPKIPAMAGDSWRPTAAGLLSALPLAAASAALAAAAVVGGTPGAGVMAGQHGAALPPGSMPFTTVTALGGTDPKIPTMVGD